ncbi:MAG: alanine racemase [Geminicoccaceae bacterium]
MATEAARAVLTVDLGAIVENYGRLQREAPGAEIAAVVKADGYGLGLGEVAAALWQGGGRSFLVAHPGEGIALRAALPEATIYVLHGLQGGGGEALAAAALIPVLNHPGELARYAARARARKRRLPAALQIDTGMCRLGLAAGELERLDRADLDALDLRLVMSHLACAEESDHPMNQKQLARFERLRRLLPPAPASLANSSGIFLGPAFHHQLCRPGVALYGVNPTPARANPMAPVVTLEAPVLQVHEVGAPGSVGYGATHRTRAGARVATVPVGYADGYLRAAGERATARIAGHEVPLAGRVSMDLISLDVSALAADAVRPGTMVELIGGPDGVDRLAAAASTIGYEVLTRLGSRFARRYTRPAAKKPGP